MDMCRFRGPEDVEYKKVANALRRMIANLPEARIPNTSPSLTNEHRQQLRDSLAFDQIDARHATIKRAHVRTCKWLKNKDEYLDWLNPSKISEHHGFLWVKGNPGTGKSTLMKFAFDQARKTMKDKVILSFFFNARGEELERSTAGMYRSLLLQLLQRIPGLETIFDSLRLTSLPQGGQVQWSVELLKDAFEQAVQKLGQSWVVCFIDALDECDEDQIRDMRSFFEHTGALAIASNIRFQICFSSRHYPSISIAHGLELVLEGQEGHNQDIANYIDSELKIGHSIVAKETRAELQAKASGVFMWVVLVVDILNKEYDRGRIHTLRKRLRELPDRLHDLFRDILSRDARDRDELILCIQWVLFSKWPLRPEELYFAVLAGTNPESLVPWEQELTTLTIIQRFIIDSSKGLAETTKSKTPVVQFIHESVRDFLLKDNGLREIWPDLGDRFQGQSHEQLKNCCLKQVCTDIAGPLRLPIQVPKGLSKRTAELRDLAQQSFPFLKYAVRNVLYHTDEAESEGITQNSFLQSFPLEKWIYLQNFLEKYETRHRTLDANLLHQAAEDGYLAVAKLLVEAGAHKEAIDNARRTPLYWTAWNGHLDVAKLLVEAGANTEAKDKDKVTPLSRALRNKHFNVAELLVEASADKEAKDDYGRTLLYQAAENGLSDIVKMLIKLGANIEAKNTFENTPLHLTADRGYLDIAELLVEAGANIEAKTTIGLTPLLSAASHGQLDVAKLLIKAGANTDAKTASGETPLYLAASYGYLNVAELLIEAGANIEAETTIGLTLLHLAASYGHLNVAELLVKAGANIEAKTASGETPLHLAANYGHLNVAELLVKVGANIVAKTIHSAASYGHLNIAELLIKAGADREAKQPAGGRHSI